MDLQLSSTAASETAAAAAATAAVSDLNEATTAADVPIGSSSSSNDAANSSGAAAVHANTTGSSSTAGPSSNSDGSSSSSSTQSEAAAAAAAAAAASPNDKQPLSQQQQLYDVLDGCSVALTTASLALAVALCALTLNIQGLAWAGVVQLGFILASPIVVGALILARNHWLVVALRYCLSVAALQRDSGLSFAGLKSRALRLLLSGLSSCLLTMVGFVVAFYLTACYVVTAVLSVPLLDVSLCVSLLPCLRRRFISQDLVFLESYKPARSVVSGLLQALPLAAVSLLLLTAALTPSSQAPGQTSGQTPSSSSNASLANSSSGSSKGARRLLLLQPQLPLQQRAHLPAAAAATGNIHSSSSSQKAAASLHQQQHSVRRRLAAAAAATQQPLPDQAGPDSSSSNQPQASSSLPWTPEALSKALAVALNRSSQAAAAMAAAMGGGSSSSSSSAGGGLLPTVQVIASEGSDGDIALTDVVPPIPGAPGAAAAGSSDDSSSDGSSSDGRTFIGLSSSSSSGLLGPSSSSSDSSSSSPRKGLSGSGAPGFSRSFLGSSSSSSSSHVVLTAPSWDVITSCAKQLPLVLLYAGVIIGLADAALVLLLLLLGCRAARVGFWRQLGLTLRLKGGLRIPGFVAREALGHMLKDGGTRLHLSNVWYWNNLGDGGKLPLVPRYLFPPDGGWLVPGQMCHLAALAFDSLSNNAARRADVQVLELEHAASCDIAVLLRGGLDQLPGLKGLNLNWCGLGPKALPAQLLHSKTLETLNLNRCELSDGGAAILKTLLSTPHCPLKTLGIVKCHMSAAAAKAVAQGLAVNSSLTSMKFAGNNGGKAAAVAFAAALRANKTLQHLNLSFNKLCPSGGDALAAALTDQAAAAADGSSSSSSSSRGLQRLVVQRKEVGGAGLRALIQALRRCSSYTGQLTLRVLHGPGGQGLAAGAGAAGGLEPCVLQLVELPVLFVIHEDQELLISEAWMTQLMTHLEQQQQGDGSSSVCCAVAAAGAAGVQGDNNSSSNAHTVITVCDDEQQLWGEAAAAAVDAVANSSSSRDQDCRAAAKAPAVAPEPAGSSSCSKAAGISSSSSSSSSSSIAGFSVAAAAATFLKPCRSPSSRMTLDGPTPMGSTADCISQQAVAAATAAASDGSSSGSSGRVCCPSLIFLSQNDVCDSVAAALKSVEGLAVADLSGLTLGNKGVTAVAAALPEASSLQQLLLRDTGLLDDGATALATALVKRMGTATATCPGAATAVTAAAAAAAGGASGNRSSSRSGGAAAHSSRHSSSSRNIQTAAHRDRHNRSSSSSGGGGVDRSNAVAVDQQPDAAAATAAAAAAVLQDDAVVPSQLRVLDLSQNTICDFGATALAAAVHAGACPKLQLLSLIDNRYPFDWSTILQLQRLEVLQPGLRVELGAPSSWCLNPEVVLQGGSSSSSGSSSRLLLPSGRSSTSSASSAAAAAGVEGGAAGSSSSSSGASSVSSEDLCGVCLDAPNSLHIRSCSHQLCIDCYKQLVKAATGGSSGSSSRQLQQQGRSASGGCPACPFCRTPMTGFMYSAWVQQ